MPDGGRFVRPPLLAVLRSDNKVCLPSEVEQLLLGVVADGFMLYCCGCQAAPTALVASYQWENYVDLVTIRRFDCVTTARIVAPNTVGVDVFAPQIAVWTYEGPPQRALRALLDLVHPEHPDAPTSTYPAPLSLHIPRAEQRPMTIRLPRPRRVEVRAARLAAAITVVSNVPIMANAGCIGKR